MSTTRTTRSLGEAAEAISDLFDQGMRIGMDLLDSLSCGRTWMMGPTMSEMLDIVTSRLRPAERCGCKIPPPCWAPQPLGEVRSHVCPGGTASIRICVTNCGTTHRDITIEATGQTTGITVTPSSVSLGPMERGVAVASAAMPADAASGQEREVLLWVRGCQQHFLRWIVKVSARGVDTCHEVDVEDCPDLIHHWYDHFYCERPCLHHGQ